ncbi:MFS transporter [Glutamicibacter arilaitensis]|uniref:MFS transporter n=1 Tax=Glutamicibacter arilaitensis TaxID=256701 RepID=UPI003FD505ED
MTARERWKLLVLLSASFTLAVDFSVLNVALPEIGRDVGIQVQDLQWIITAFALPAAGFGLLFGRLGDLVGRRLFFIAGICLLGIGSLIGGIADTSWLLIAGRIVQGFGAAAVAPTALSLLTTSFEEGPRRSRALGINGALISAGFTTGALLGGVLTSGLSWRWAFFINIPVAILVLILTPILFAESRPNERPRLDLAGAVLISAALASLVFGLTIAGETGLSVVAPYPWLAAAVVLLLVFGWVESRAQAPLVAVRILRKRTVAFGNLAGLTTFSMMSSLTYLLTLYLQDVLLLNAVLTGLVIAVIGIVSVVAANFTPWIIGKFGQKGLVVAALFFQGIGSIVLAFAGPNLASLVLVLAGIVIGALGHIGSIVGYTVTSTSGLPDSEQGLATGLTTTSQQVGLALGTPIMATILAIGIGDRAADDPGALLGGLTTAIAANGIIVLAVAVIVAIFLPGASATKKMSGATDAATEPVAAESQ